MSSPTSSRRGATEEEEKLLAQKGYVEGDKVVLFDGVCNLCNGWVSFVLSMKRGADFKFAPLQSEAGGALLRRVGKEPGDLDSLVFIEDHAVHLRSTAALKVMEQAGSPIVASLASLALCLPSSLRDWVYSDIVAPNRYRLFGKSETCRRPTAAERAQFL